MASAFGFFCIQYCTVLIVYIYKYIKVFYYFIKKMEMNEIYAECGGYTGIVAAGKHE